jgi:hypothetical protein
MRPATLAEAEAAKETLKARLFPLPELRGIGIALLDDGFGVKVNLSSWPEGLIVPDEVDGVPVIVEIVGTIRPL